MNKFIRTEALLGEKSMEKLKHSKVAIFGIGGVGSFAVEALARSGIGNLVLIDYDTIDVSNINRQIHANINTIGRPKVEVMRDRILEINPDINVEVFNEKYTKENKDKLISISYDYVVDAIDMVSSKIDLIKTCKEKNINIISSMGAGNKLCPERFNISDIKKTHTCPLAKVIRRELKKLGIKSLKVVWSDEEPMKTNLEGSDLRKAVPGSIAFVPSVVGLIIAREVIKDLSLEV